MINAQIKLKLPILIKINIIPLIYFKLIMMMKFGIARSARLALNAKCPSRKIS